ncbi:TraI domain-containing protein [Paraburkholderia sp. MMS20-SJTR3]|uniref:TraI domain-containing protein n=1 Tax=Paraburkholderia sejongensis TaxID=2886946 RepID=A0ABS8K593_9BURK|nr:TraI domain-containing protein [Paraburkholderia sp. MMS20-SJTR3]MCC8397311.1 TraI domain-containing protein [Paraburkholderia sp. MMS20-SJTR3]
MSIVHRPMKASDLLATHEKRIELVRQCANESTESEFERKWLSVLRRCAAWFSSMPLTPELHAEPGGAFRATIESTFYAMRLAGGQKFAADMTSDKRRRLEPQYIYAVFLAAACSSLDEPCRHFEIVRVADHLPWSPAAHGAFGNWVGEGDYLVQRRATPLKSERMRTAMFAQTVITPELLAWLDSSVLADLFGAINPERSPQGFEALVHKVVRQAMDVSVEFERKAQRGVFAPVKFDVPSAVHVALELQPQVVAATPVPGAPTEAAALAPSAETAGAPAAAPLPSSSAAQPNSGSAPGGPQLSQSLLDALERSEAQAATAAATGPVDPSAVRATAAAAVDPTQMAAGAPVAARPSRNGPTDEELTEVLGPGSAMMREFFRALAGDVAAGKAKVTWEEKGLAVQKRLIGGYGITSDTLVEQLRKRSLLLRAAGNDICIVERAGRLIMERPAT